MKNRFYKLSHPDLFHESNYNIVAIAISRRQFEPPRSGNWVRLVVVDIWDIFMLFMFLASRFQTLQFYVLGSDRRRKDFKIAIIANFEMWNLQYKHRPQGKQSKGGICYFCWKVSEKFDLRCWNIWIPQFETKWIIQVGVRATFIGASVQLFSICRKYLLKMRGVAWDYFFVVGGEPGGRCPLSYVTCILKDTKIPRNRWEGANCWQLYFFWPVFSAQLYCS